MNIIESCLTKIHGYYQQLLEQYGKNALLGALGLIILILFSDTLLPIIWHFLVLAWHLVEATIEHFLDELFGIRHWHADFISFWFCTSIAAIIGWRISKKVYGHGKTVCVTCKCKWQSKPKYVRSAIIAAAATVVVIFNM